MLLDRPAELGSECTEHSTAGSALAAVFIDKREVGPKSPTVLHLRSGTTAAHAGIWHAGKLAHTISRQSPQTNRRSDLRQAEVARGLGSRRALVSTADWEGKLFSQQTANHGRYAHADYTRPAGQNTKVQQYQWPRLATACNFPPRQMLRSQLQAEGGFTARGSSRPAPDNKMHRRRRACSFSGRCFSCATWGSPFVWVSTAAVYRYWNV